VKEHVWLYRYIGQRTGPDTGGTPRVEAFSAKKKERIAFGDQNLDFLVKPVACKPPRRTSTGLVFFDPLSTTAAPIKKTPFATRFWCFNPLVFGRVFANAIKASLSPKKG
jgi:hypothetical protein